jgi:hypothetical protein
MFLTSRPHAGDGAEPTLCRAILSLAKLIAKDSPAEIQIVLGWRIDTRRMLMALPQDKYDNWAGAISQIIAHMYCTRDELEPYWAN